MSWSPANEHLGQIERLASVSRHDVSVLVDVRDMPQQYGWADGVIGAAGTSCWEWLYCGLDAAITVIADNQIPNYNHLTELGYAVGFDKDGGSSVAELTSALASFIQRLPRGRSSSVRFRDFIDGHGAARFAAAMDGGVWLRPALPSDCRIYFDWVNDPLVRRNSLNSGDVSWSTHQRWFTNQLASPDSRMYVAMCDEEPVGQVRFHKTPEQAWDIAISVSDRSRGKGNGAEIMRLGAERMSYRGCLPLVATARSDNEASIRCLRRNGWDEVPSEQDGRVCYRMVAR